MNANGDPRISRPRLPKPYTEEQLAFLKSHVSGFETRTRGHVRGDAKKFALDRASEFLVRFGLPSDLQGVAEAEPRFREQIYNWYKNTVGRARRKLEGRTKSKKPYDRGSTSRTSGITWASDVATSSTISYVPPTDSDQASTSTPHPGQTPPQSQSQPRPNPGPSPAPPPPQQHQLQFTFQSTVSVPTPSTIALNVTLPALRDAFLTPAIDAPSLSSHIQSYILSHPSATPLVPVVCSLFDAASHILARGSGIGAPGEHDREQLFALLRRFIDACAFFPSTLVHADVNGPLAGPRALQIALRKASVWAPMSLPLAATTTTTTTTTSSSTSTATAATHTEGHGSLSDEMERIAADRQRRKEYVQWAQIHAAALELGILPSSSTPPAPSAPPPPPTPVPVPLSSPTTVVGVGGLGMSVGVEMGVGMGGVGMSSGATYHHRQSSDISSYSHTIPPSPSPHPHPHAHAHPHPHPHSLPLAHPHPHPHPLAHPHPHVLSHAHALAHIQHAPPTSSPVHGHTSTPPSTSTTTFTSTSTVTSTPTNALACSFSELMARDAVWENDEVEWVAGIIVLRALIRVALGVSTSGVGGGSGSGSGSTGTGATGTIGTWKKTDYALLLSAYERRWKEIKDEARQAIVTEVLLGAREDLARMEDVRVT